MTEWLDERENRAWRALQAVLQPLETALNRQLSKDSGLSTADYTVLVALSEAEQHRLRIRDLVRITCWEKSRVSHQIRRMESRGLLVRTDCPTDARGSFIRLTAEGLVTIQSAAPAHVAEVRRLVIDALSPAQLDQLAEIAEAIGRQVTASEAAAQNCPAEPAAAACPEESSSAAG